MIEENPETIRKLFEETFSHKNLNAEHRNIDKEFAELKMNALTQELGQKDNTIKQLLTLTNNLNNTTKQLLTLINNLKYYMTEMLLRNPSFNTEPSSAMRKYNLLRQGYEEMLREIQKRKTK